MGSISTLIYTSELILCFTILKNCCFSVFSDVKLKHIFQVRNRYLYWIVLKLSIASKSRKESSGLRQEKLRILLNIPKFSQSENILEYPDFCERPKKVGESLLRAVIEC